ncbi:MAG: RluA family pseudouridine synthase [Erysipelotrichaceae bacterium]|nr:RluA family pseudouridine synthase [Erysipelotrichaceae bacterium]
MEYKLEKNILKISIASLFNETVQSFLDDFVPSKKMQHLLIQNKWITMDGNPVKREDDIAGMELEINIYPEVYDYRKCDGKPDIVYEDEIIVIVNKPKEVLVHSDGNEEDTLTGWLQSYYSDRPCICVQALHRLDRETSGLVAFSKSMVFQPLLDKLLSEKQIRRYYLAFVKGIVERNRSFNIDKPIGKDRHDPKKRIVYKDGQQALTRVKSLGYSRSRNFSILRCSLDSGRTHQIRVHLSSEGLPILNDPLYGIKSDLLVRMGLLADEMEFYHPLKQEMLNVDIDLPNDMARLYFSVVK